MTRDTFKAKGNPPTPKAVDYKWLYENEKQITATLAQDALDLQNEVNLLLEAYKQWQKLGGVEVGLIAKIEAIYPTE